MVERDDMKVAMVALLGFLGTVLVIVIVLAMMTLYYRTAAQFEDERVIRQANVELDSALADQQVRLLEYAKAGVLEQGGTTVAVYRIPIERAMERVLADWKSGVLPGEPVSPEGLGAAATAPAGGAQENKPPSSAASPKPSRSVGSSGSKG